ncbi:MAG TPA: ABC transporter permease [Chloroflexota bacterium]
MHRYLLRRAAQSFVLLWVVSALFFTFQRLAPGGPEAYLVDPKLSESDKRIVLSDWGLDQPIPLQYARWIGHVLQGDLGRSFQDRRPVWEKILERVPNTLYLNTAGFLIGLLGIPLGVWAAVNRARFPDHLVRLFTVVFTSLPDWWLGLMLLVLLAASWRIFPLGGMYTVGQDSLPDRLWHLVLPALIAGIGGWVGSARILRSEMLEALGHDYIRTARAKGLRERAVYFKHALRNSLIPFATGLGGTLTGLIGGTVLYERVFSWPGMGRLYYDAALQRDFPTTQGLFLIFTALVLLGYLISDVATAAADPRIRFE